MRELLLEADANVRFSWIMLGREPRSDKAVIDILSRELQTIMRQVGPQPSQP